jgi:hypothetical protein
MIPLAEKLCESQGLSGLSEDGETPLSLTGLEPQPSSPSAYLQLYADGTS